MLHLFWLSMGFHVLESERVSPTCPQSPAGGHLVLASVAPMASGPRLSTPGDMPTEKPMRQLIGCFVLLDTLVAIEKEASLSGVLSFPISTIGLLA